MGLEYGVKGHAFMFFTRYEYFTMSAKWSNLHFFFWMRLLVPDSFRLLAQVDECYIQKTGVPKILVLGFAGRNWTSL